MRKAVLILLLVAACVQGMQETPYSEFGARDRTLDTVKICVVNESIDAYRIRVNHIGRGSVYPTEKKIIEIPSSMLTGPVTLIAQGVTTSADIIPEEIMLAAYPRWEWVIGTNTTMARLQIRPVDRSQCGGMED